MADVAVALALLRIPNQIRHLHMLVEYIDMTCLRNLRMDHNAFGHLCYLLAHSGGISNTKFITMLEQMAMFLSVIAHHKKNWVVKHDFILSGRTVSKHFHADCLGVLDGTFINVRVSEQDKGRYRPRKGHVAVNILGVCNPNMQFICLNGLGREVAVNKMLHDAINRRNGLWVPTGNYYLCGNDYQMPKASLPHTEVFVITYVNGTMEREDHRTARNTLTSNIILQGMLLNGRLDC
ncbi:UNVERIFIED_CONTAM: hypothetical protein Slati_3099400 [Sesamum latifolium]|uniref:DUF8040 domain-containing protein n=1 Tax=Sesamum latifolium TaxID=2727402 RepID=A0AAW2UWW6_9LAMI